VSPLGSTFPASSAATPSAPAPLDDHPRPLDEEHHRARDLLLGDHDHLVDVAVDQLVRER